MLLASVIALASFVALVLVYFALTKYLENKKAQAAAAPAPARTTLEPDNLDEPDDPYTIVPNPDQRARDEMLENARAMAKENPEHAAKLLRTWIQEEK